MIWFTCNKLPKVGRINLTYALTSAGTTRTEYTIVREAEDSYYLVSAGAWQAYDHDYLRKAVEDKEAEFGRINVQDLTSQYGVFALAGPNARAIPCRADPRHRARNRAVEQAFPVAVGA